MHCPGSTQAQEGKADETSRYAAEGTAAHELAEHCLRTNTDACNHRGKKFNGFEVDDGMSCAVQAYLNIVRRILAEHPGAVLHLESAVDLTWVDPDVGGTPDAIIVVPFGPVFVIDYKHGAGVAVEADHLQFKLLGLSALDRDPEQIIAVVVQPRAPHPDGIERHHAYTPEELHAWIADVRAAAIASRAANPPRVAGAWCRWCRDKACPQLGKKALAEAQMDFGSVLYAAETGAGLIPPSHVSQLTPKQAARLLEAADIIEAWLKAARAVALDFAKQGTLPGYKIVAGRKGTRKWGDELEASAAIRAAGLDPYVFEVRSPAHLEKALGRKGMAPFAGFIVQAEGRPELAPVADKRPAIALDPAADFRDDPLDA